MEFFLDSLSHIIHKVFFPFLQIFCVFIMVSYYLLLGDFCISECVFQSL